MRMTRRAFTAGAATLALAPQKLFARLELGSATLETVSDGHLVLPGEFSFVGMPDDVVETVRREFNISPDRITPECNLALYRDGTNTVLFDVGSGPDFMPSAGKTIENLDALGIAPEDVTHVVFTHAHPDHIWGLLDDFDEPAFYEATYMMGRVEWEYWWNPETVNSIGEARAAFAVGAKRRMEAIVDNVTLFDDGNEILSGIAAFATFGHTPGHMSFEVRSGNQTALIVGDAVTNHHVAFRAPVLANPSDQDPDTAAKSRESLLNRAANEHLAIVGFHLPNGGMGHVEADANAFRFVEGGF